VIADRAGGKDRKIAGMTLPMHGAHNVQNALAAIAVGHEMGVPEDRIRDALAGFGGVNRRFTKTGEAGGITVIDDYGHHPVEIAAVLKAARGSTEGHIVAVVQPHRYTRVRDLFEEFCTCFNDADAVVVADIYPAGEEPIPGIDRDALAEGLRAHGHRQVIVLDTPVDLPALIDRIAGDGDMVVCLGAGSVTNWANSLPAQLGELRGPQREACG
jgi:UDP-N-acetylmuramate--alanine ligase